MHNTGIVICSRLDSERLPNKVMRKINNETILTHLLRQVIKLNLPVVVAVPYDQYNIYSKELSKNKEFSDVILFGSTMIDDPLARTLDVQIKNEFSDVIRVTHDKIFIDTISLPIALEEYYKNKADYLYSSSLIPGSGFEIISKKCLSDASSKFKNVEHISYAVRLTSKNSINFNCGRPKTEANLLIDFPEDIKMMELIFSQLGARSCLDDVICYLNENPDLIKINKPPKYTIYTCAYNAEKYIDQAMASAIQQDGFKSEGEYIIIDDCSTDKTCEKIARFCIGKNNITWIRNNKNIGLASSCNIAIKKARGKYIIRLDADDYLRNSAIGQLVSFAEKTESEIVYPDNYYGDFMTIQSGKENHHCGGSLFDKKALNFVKFTDGLRNYEGLDLFERAREKLKIGYYEKPLFLYRQHDESMSKNNIEERNQTREMILNEKI